MKKEQRLVYRELTETMGASLCNACKYSKWISDGCCEGDHECQHPVERLSFENLNEKMLEPGGDCYGFRPDISVSLLADVTGVIISQGFSEWFFRHFSKTSVTVYGRNYKGNVITEGKVRIG